MIEKSGSRPTSFAPGPRPTTAAPRDSLIAVSLPAVDTTLVAPLDPLALLDQLPARARADLSWARPAIQKALESLHEEPLDDERLSAATRAFFEPMPAIAAALFQHLPASDNLSLSSRGMEAFRAEGFGNLDPHTRDMALDALTILSAIFARLATEVGGVRLDVSTAESLKDPDALESWAASPMARAYVCLFAADKMPPSDDPARQAHASELVGWAFLMLSSTLDQLARVGVVIDPFADEPKGDRTLRAAEALREVLDDEDLQILSDARMRDLR